MKKMLIGLAVLIAVVAISCSTTQRPAANVGPLSPVSTVTAAPVPTTSPAPTGPVTAFGDGTYEVGVDIVAGRYKTQGGGTLGSCYYKRMPDDSSGKIIQNNFFQGPGSFTTKKGEFVEVSGGCAWTKQ